MFLDAWHRPGPRPELDATAGEVVVLGGCVVDPPVFRENREQFLLELAPGARAAIHLLLRPGEAPPPLTYGQNVEVEARVRKPHNFNNPGAFDYAAYLARQQIFWTGSIPSGSPIKILPGECGSPFFRAMFALRTMALDRIQQFYPSDSYSTGMMGAILIGDSTRLERIWTQNFRRTGTFHALVISGQHVSVLAITLLFLLRLLFVPDLLAVGIAAIAAWIYAAVSGWSAPVVRAAGGFSIYLVARYFYRRGRILNLVAVVAIGYLIYDPGQLFDASFELSFLSVLAIAVLAIPLLEATSVPWSRGLRNLTNPDADPLQEPRVAQFRVELRLIAETLHWWTRLPQTWIVNAFGTLLRLAIGIFDLMAVSAVMQIGLALPMAIFFHRVSFSGLSANVIVVPLLSAVVPIGFVAIFSGWKPVAWVAAKLLAIAEAVAGWHARLEPNWRIPDPPLWLSLAFVLSLVLLGVTVRIQRWRWPSLVLTLGLFGWLLWQPGPPRTQPGTLELTAIDVGQGDSLLVAFPDGKLMLVDGGGVPAFGNRPKPRLEIGEDVVSPYLWQRKIRRLDVVAATHGHEDHVGGLVAVLDNFRPAELWTGATPEAPEWSALFAKARQVGTRIVARSAPEAFGLGGAEIRILAPSAGYEPSSTPKNNDSLAFEIHFGDHRFLLTGDMEKQVEGHLIFDGVLQKADVLKVAHHGSRTSSIDLFLDAVQPMVAIISDGFENSFHHPHPDVLRRLADRHAEILRTDLMGRMTVSSDGHRLSVETQDVAGKEASWMPAW